MSNPAWVNLAEDRLIVFPGKSYFDLSVEQFKTMGIPAPGADDALLFGLSGRLLKDGRSLSLSLPRPGKDLFLKLLSYLHRVRMDALNGYILGSYFQPQTLWGRNDLVWFGRPLQLFDSLKKVHGINPCSIARSNKNKRGNLLRGRNSIARTPLVTFSKTRIDVIDLLSKQTRPFAFVIDATPSGIRSDLKELSEGLSISFPDIPYLIISALGDRQTDETLNRIPVHRWIYRLQDQHQWQLRRVPDSQQPAFPWRHTLVEVPDKILDGYLSEIYVMIYHFKKQIASESLLVKKNTYNIAAKIQQTLATLCCPLNLREAFLARHSRRGIFPVRTIERQLELLDGAAVRYGEAEASRKTIHDKLSKLYALLSKGTPGKVQALKLFVKKAMFHNRSTLILVADKYEEEAVTDYLHKKDIALVDDKLLSVKPAGHLKSAQSLHPTYSQCLIFTRMWDQNMWWLGGIAKQIYWFCYPFEKKYAYKKLASWEETYLHPSSHDGSKSDLLRLALPGKSYLKDQTTEKAEITVTQELLTKCSGSYFLDKPFAIEHDDHSLKWLTEILAAEEQIEEEVGSSHSAAGDANYARITVDELLLDIQWPVGRPVSVLSDAGNLSELERKKIEDLNSGDQIILLEGDDVHQEVLHNLFETFHSQDNISEVIRWASCWESIVDSAAEKFKSPQKLRKALQQKGTSVTPATVNNWLSKKVFGPEDELSVKNMALIVGDATLARYAPKIHTAIKRIWTEHRNIGRDLRQALLSRATGATSVKIGAMTLDMETLDELLKIYTVHSVELPGDPPVYPKTLADLAPQIQEKLGSKILLTPRAIRSMENSPYRNLDKAWNCFEVIATDLWRFFNKELLPAEVKKSFKQIGVELKNKTSAITQGMSSDYEVKYEGKTVDIGAHLCLGTARDPAKTLRIHYHWDSTKTLIIIHHAGRHLTIRST